MINRYGGRKCECFYSVLFFSAGYKEVVTFSVLLLFLFVRPGGLFGSLVED
jgi:branched-subunit amino acid ABC-type transport system permease component